MDAWNLSDGLTSRVSSWEGFLPFLALQSHGYSLKLRLSHLWRERTKTFFSYNYLHRAQAYSPPSASTGQAERTPECGVPLLLHSFSLLPDLEKIANFHHQIDLQMDAGKMMGEILIKNCRICYQTRIRLQIA